MNWMGTQITGVSAAQTRDAVRDWILLDSEPSVDLFCNPAYVTNIHKVDEQLVLATNAGSLTTNLKATIPEYGEVWYDPKAMTNALSLANMTDKHHVPFHAMNDNALVALTPQGPTHFVCGPGNLYYKNPNHKKAILVETLHENMKFYTPRQVGRARQAKKLLHTLACPTVQDLKSIIRMNSIKNCPVTIDDINLADKIFGKDIDSLKGKTT